MVTGCELGLLHDTEGFLVESAALDPADHLGVAHQALLVYDELDEDGTFEAREFGESGILDLLGEPVKATDELGRIVYHFVDVLGNEWRSEQEEEGEGEGAHGRRGMRERLSFQDTDERLKLLPSGLTAPLLVAEAVRADVLAVA